MHWLNGYERNYWNNLWCEKLKYYSLFSVMERSNISEKVKKFFFYKYIFISLCRHEGSCCFRRCFVDLHDSSIFITCMIVSMVVFACFKNKKEKNGSCSCGSCWWLRLWWWRLLLVLRKWDISWSLVSFPGNDFGLGLHRLWLIYLSSHSIYYI